MDMTNGNGKEGAIWDVSVMPRFDGMMLDSQNTIREEKGVEGDHQDVQSESADDRHTQANGGETIAAQKWIRMVKRRTRTGTPQNQSKEPSRSGPGIREGPGSSLVGIH